MLALSEFTMTASIELDGGYALYKPDLSAISKDTFLTEKEFRDFGGYVYEIWKYDPSIFKAENLVDDLSLLSILNDSADERIQMGLDVIRRKHHIPIIPEY